MMSSLSVSNNPRFCFIRTRTMNQLIFLVLSVSVMAYKSNACQSGNEAIQTALDGFQLFRKTKAFDPADAKIPLEQYSFFNNDGEKRLSVKINGDYMMEYYKTDGDNKDQTKSGQYYVTNMTVILNYKREEKENGEFSFDDWSNQKKFKSSLRSIDADIPSDFEEDYKQVLIDLNAMRKKMFAFKNGLSKEDFERVLLFDHRPFSKGDGLYGQYIENDGGNLTMSKENGNDEIFGQFSCGYKREKYSIVDGNVVIGIDRYYVLLNRLYS